jgi:hypothetical protein
VLRIYYVDDDKTGATISKRASFRTHSFGRWCYYTWLLNNDLEYFFYSPVPFIKAATMLPVSARYCRRSLLQSLNSLRTVWARILVLCGLPGALAIYAFDTARRGAGPQVAKASF